MIAMESYRPADVTGKNIQFLIFFHKWVKKGGIWNKEQPTWQGKNRLCPFTSRSCLEQVNRWNDQPVQMNSRLTCAVDHVAIFCLPVTDIPASERYITQPIWVPIVSSYKFVTQINVSNLTVFLPKIQWDWLDLRLHSRNLSHTHHHLCRFPFSEKEQMAWEDDNWTENRTTPTASFAFVSDMCGCL